MQQSGSKMRNNLGKMPEVRYRGRTEARNNLLTHVGNLLRSGMTEARIKAD